MSARGPLTEPTVVTSLPIRNGQLDVVSTVGMLMLLGELHGFEPFAALLSPAHADDLAGALQQAAAEARERQKGPMRGTHPQHVILDEARLLDDGYGNDRGKQQQSRD